MIRRLAPVIALLVLASCGSSSNDDDGDHGSQAGDGGASFDATARDATLGGPPGDDTQADGAGGGDDRDGNVSDASDGAALDGGSNAPPIPTPLALSNNDFVATGSDARSHVTTGCSPSGALGTNVEFEAEVAGDGGVTDSLLIEEQRGGASMVEEGIVDLLRGGDATAAEALVNEGLYIMKWGFATEVLPGKGASGSNPNDVGSFCYQGDCAHYPTGDVWHSSELFVEDVAWSLLLLEQFCATSTEPLCQTGPTTYTVPCTRGLASGAPARTVSDLGSWRSFVETYKPYVQASLGWFALGTNFVVDGGAPAQEKQRAHNAPYTHRRWVDAAMFAEGAALLGASSGDGGAGFSYRDVATLFAREGLALQTADGVNPEGSSGSIVYANWPATGYATELLEQHGFDGNYQDVGILMGAHFVSACAMVGGCADANGPLEGDVTAMALKGLARESQIVLPNGVIFCAPAEVSARYACTRDAYEEARSGALKTMDYFTAIRAFSYWNALWASEPAALQSVALVSDAGADTVAAAEGAVAAEAKALAMNLSTTTLKPWTLVTQPVLEFASNGPVYISVPDGGAPDAATPTLPIVTSKTAPATFPVPVGLSAYQLHSSASGKYAPSGVQFTVNAVDATDAIANVSDNVTVTLSSSSGSGATSAVVCGGTSPCSGGSGQTVVIALNKGKASFRVQDSMAESVTITVNDSAVPIAYAGTRLPTSISFVNGK